MSGAKPARLIVPAHAEGDVIVAAEGLSFWGGVDPETSRVIDAHHPFHGQTLAGKIVLMPTSRGSCSGSGVLLHLALGGNAPAALVFHDAEEVLTLGALIAERMFSRPVAILQLPQVNYDRLAGHPRARLEGETLSFGDHRVSLCSVSQQDLALSETDRAMLDGRDGPAVAQAMEVITMMAAAQGARQLTDVTRGHIDGCILAHRANLVFAEAMAERGARVRVPTTINAISVDRARVADHALRPDFARDAMRLADAYVRMGAAPTFTCAPYHLDDTPSLGERIGWSESNAVIYANSVLGARTPKHPDYLDLFIAMTGRAPESGVYLDEARRPAVIIDIDCPEDHDDALWPLLGWLAGQHAPGAVPRLDGLAACDPSADDLRALCAAFGTTSAAPMLHITGVTPEADLPLQADAETVRITGADIQTAWAAFNAGPRAVDLIALGSPHLSLDETRHFAALMAGHTCHEGVAVVLTLGRGCRADAVAEGLLATLEAAGIQVLADLCWCSITEPILPPTARTIMTNSGKYAHYAPGLSGRAVRFGSLADCALAAQTSLAPDGPPKWLGP